MMGCSVVQLGPLPEDLKAARFLVVGPTDAGEAREWALSEIPRPALERATSIEITVGTLPREWIATVRYPVT